MTAPVPLHLRHVALLRGINVGGHRKVGMPALAKVFTELGYEGVQTYIQSGNVMFKAHVTDAAQLEAAIEAHFGFPVQVALRTGAEWARAIADNPYPQQAASDGSKVHLALLSAEPDAEGIASLQAVPRGEDNWHLEGRPVSGPAKRRWSYQAGSRHAGAAAGRGRDGAQLEDGGGAG